MFLIPTACDFNIDMKIVSVTFPNSPVSEFKEAMCLRCKSLEPLRSNKPVKRKANFLKKQMCFCSQYFIL